MAENPCKRQKCDNKPEFWDKQVLESKGLVCVMDIDNTILESCFDLGALTAPDIIPCCVDRRQFAVRFRPYARECIRQLHELGYMMVLMTNGNRVYVDALLPFLDPDGKVFGDRIYTHEKESDPFDKSLDRLPLLDKSLAVVIDDRQDIWDKMDKLQLLQVLPYHYLTDNVDEKKWPTDSDHVLPSLVPVLATLKQLAHLHPSVRHTASLLALIRRTVLSQCTLAFCNKPRIPPALISTARLLGAKCVEIKTEASQCCDQLLTRHRVTHIVTPEPIETKTTIPQVHPVWIAAALQHFHKPSEASFNPALGTSLELLERPTQEITNVMELVKKCKPLVEKLIDSDSDSETETETDPDS